MATEKIFLTKRALTLRVVPKYGELNHLRNTKHQTLTLVGEGYGLRVTGYGVQVMGYGLRNTNYVTHT